MDQADSWYDVLGGILITALMLYAMFRIAPGLMALMLSLILLTL